MSARAHAWPTTTNAHPHNRCPAKTDGDKIELEFVKNMTAREYA